MQFLLWIIVGLAAGWLTGRNMKGYGYGPLMDILMGGVGGLLGGFSMSVAGSSGFEDMTYATLVAVLSGVGFTAFVARASGKQRYA